MRVVPPGGTLAVDALREELALAKGADATCATTTSIVLRIIAEAALEQFADGAHQHDVTPFLRAVDQAWG